MERGLTHLKTRIATGYLDSLRSPRYGGLAAHTLAFPSAPFFGRAKPLGCKGGSARYCGQVCGRADTEGEGCPRDH